MCRIVDDLHLIHPSLRYKCLGRHRRYADKLYYERRSTLVDDSNSELRVDSSNAERRAQNARTPVFSLTCRQPTFTDSVCNISGGCELTSLDCGERGKMSVRSRPSWDVVGTPTPRLVVLVPWVSLGHLQPPTIHRNLSDWKSPEVSKFSGTEHSVSSNWYSKQKIIYSLPKQEIEQQEYTKFIKQYWSMKCKQYRGTSNK